jgi:hypothetical protein
MKNIKFYTPEEKPIPKNGKEIIGIFRERYICNCSYGDNIWYVIDVMGWNRTFEADPTLWTERENFL